MRRKHYQELCLITGMLLASLVMITGCVISTPAPAPTPGPPQEPQPTPVPAPSPITIPKPPPSPEPVPTPTLTPASDEIVRLYYYGPSSFGGDPAALPGTHCIYSATSTDGINFTEDPGVRFPHDTKTEFGITDPDVVRLNDGSWLMFTSLGASLMKATATTSSGTFTKDEAFIWNRGGVPGSHNFDGTVRTFVCFEGGIHMATYDQNNGTLNYAGVALEAPASGLVADPSVIQVGSQYLMVYKYATSHTAFPSEHEIYLAESTDGITWTQHDQNRFISNGSVPGAVYFNDTLYIYYCGRIPKPGARPGDVGVAISEENGATFTFSTINIHDKASAGAVDPAAVVVNP